MAKKKAEKTIKEKLLEVLHACNEVFVSHWEEAWVKYKTIIGPFVKGTLTYLWTLVYGSVEYVGSLIYGFGKVLYEAFEEWLKRA